VAYIALSHDLVGYELQMEPVCVSTIGADEAVGSSTKQAPPFWLQ
jgi:hypothetical protein